MTLDEMRKLCRGRNGDIHREPYDLELNGEPWVVMNNGHVATCVRRGAFELPKLEPPKPPYVGAPVLNSPLPSQRKAKLEGIRAWLRSVVGHCTCGNQRLITCARCHGRQKGERKDCESCKGTGECRCSCCEDVHCCNACDGRGKTGCVCEGGLVPCPDCRGTKEVLVCGIEFDGRQLLRGLVPDFMRDEEVVTLGASNGSDLLLSVRAADWRIVVAPCLTDAPRIPCFEENVPEPQEETT